MRFLPFYVLIIFIAFSCSHSKRAGEVPLSYFPELAIIQNGKTIECRAPKEDIFLKRDVFSVEFNLYNDSWNLNPDVAFIAFSHNPDDLKYFAEGDISGHDNPFFSPGAAIAGYPDKSYDAAIIRGDGKHAIYYTSNDERRADVVSHGKNGIVKLRWDIPAFMVDDGPETPIAETNLNEFYIMFFVDIDGNESIDQYEYHLLTVNFQ